MYPAAVYACKAGSERHSGSHLFSIRCRHAYLHGLTGHSGLLIALDNIDEVIKIIRGSKTVQIAKAELMSHFNLSDAQSQAIVDMRLRALTGLEREKLETEYAELEKKIAEYKAILADRKLLLGVIKKEILDWNHCCDLLIRLKLKDVDNCCTSGSSSCFRNLISLQAIAASGFGKEQPSDLMNTTFLQRI